MSLTAGSCDRFVTDSIDAWPACQVAPSSVRRRIDADPIRSTVPSHIDAGDPQHDLVAGRVAILEERSRAGEHVVGEMLPADRDGESDEAGAGDGHDRRHAEQGERGEDRDREDRHRHHVTEHPSDRIGPLALAGIGLAVVAETVEPHPPAPLGPLGTAHRAAQ